MKTVSFIYSFVFAINFCIAQNPSIEFQNTIGGSLEDHSSGMKEIPNSTDQILYGSSESNISGDKTENSNGDFDLWIIRISNTGSIVWQKTIGGNQYDGVSDIAVNEDTLYLLSTSQSNATGDKTSSNFGGRDLWVLSLDVSNGNIFWQNAYGGTGQEYGSVIIEKNNALLLSGTSGSPISGNKSVGTNGMNDFWILEISKQNGSIISQQNFGSPENDRLTDMKINSSNGHIYLSGTSNEGSGGDKSESGYGADDIWLVELDENWNIANEKVFGGNEAELAPKIEFVMNSILVGATSQSLPSGNKSASNYGLSDLWVLRIDKNFNLQWDVSLGGSSTDFLNDIMTAPFNKIIVSGTTNSNNSGNLTFNSYGGSDALIIFLDHDGNIIQQQNYGGSGIESSCFVSYYNQQSQNLYLTILSNSPDDGVKNEPSMGMNDYWILKLDASSFVNTTGYYLNDNISVYPNPSQSKFTFNGIQNGHQVKIVNSKGQLIELLKSNGNNTRVWTPNNFSAGYYTYYVLNQSKIISSGKLILSK